MAAAEVTILLNERQIYDLEWLEHCYKKVRFPNPKCEEFLVEINNTLRSQSFTSLMADISVKT